MDPLVFSIAAILGKFAITKGAELLTDVGPEAVNAAKDLWTSAVDRLKKEPSGQQVISEYTKAPHVFEKPIYQLLEKVLIGDTALREEMMRLVERYERGVAEYSGQVLSSSTQGSGASAQGQGTRAQSATGRSIAISEVTGAVNVGDRNVFGGTYNEGADPKHIARIRHQQEMDRIDREWSEERKKFLIYTDGVGAVPTNNQLVLVLALWIVGSLGTLIFGSTNPFGSASYGPFLGAVIGGAVMTYVTWNKANAYSQAEKQYYERRSGTSEESFL